MITLQKYIIPSVNLQSYMSGSGEVRKIQFTGRSTYILSLPKKWMEEMHLKPGDPVNLTREANNSLLIIPNAERNSSTTNEATAIVLEKESVSSLQRKVISIYLSGYNIIHLKSKTGRISSTQRDAVREIVRKNLVGTEIIADSLETITIQVLLTLPELSVNTAIRRMFLIASSMHRDAILALGEGNYELANGVIKSDDEVDRFSLYILRNLAIATQNERVLREIGLKSPADCLSYRVAVKSIERIADHSTGIADKCLKIREEGQQQQISKSLFEKIQKMSNLSLAALSDAVEALLRRDYTMADNVVDKAKGILSLENDIISFINNDDDNNNNTVHNKMSNINIKLILEDIRRTAEYASDIAEAAMNQTIGEVITVQRRSPGQ
jgi:phosphate uptake regulator